MGYRRKWRNRNETLSSEFAPISRVSLVSLEGRNGRLAEASKFGGELFVTLCVCYDSSRYRSEDTVGDILANVDVLHGSSEALLTLSNLFFFMGLLSRFIRQVFSYGCFCDEERRDTVEICSKFYWYRLCEFCIVVICNPVGIRRCASRRTHECSFSSNMGRTCLL